MDKEKYLKVRSFAIKIFALFALSVYLFPFTTNAWEQNAKDKDDLFFHVSVDTYEPKEKSQLTYTLHLYDGVGIIESQVAPPYLEHGKVIPLFQEPRKFIERLNGREYIVTEFKYAVFPAIAGNMEIAPAEFTGYVNGDIIKGKPRLATSSGAVNKYPFQGVTFGPAKFKNFFSKAVPLRVQPTFGSHIVGISATVKQKWLPADYRINVGGTITRQISIEIKGANPDIMPSIQVPQIPDVKVYADAMVSSYEITPSMVVATFSQSMVFIPQKEGTFTIPDITVDWTYAVNGEKKEAMLEGKEFLAGTGDGFLPYPLLVAQENALVEKKEGFFYTKWKVYKYLKQYDESGFYEAFLGSILLSVLIIIFIKTIIFIFHKIVVKPSVNYPKTVARKEDLATRLAREKKNKKNS